MSDFLVTALAAALIAGANAAGGGGANAGGGAPDGGLQGMWVAEGVSPAACRIGPGGEGVLVVDRDGFSVTETACRFGGKAPAGFSAVGGKMSCSSEGETYPLQVAMARQGSLAGLSFDGGEMIVYRRC